MTGTINPNATGDFHLEGTYNGKPSYARLDHAYTIWYRFIYRYHIWTISPTPGDLANPLWLYSNRTDTGPESTNYLPDIGATGTATVEAA